MGTFSLICFAQVDTHSLTPHLPDATMKFWAHTIAFAFIAAFAITELGLTIHWRAVLIDGATGSYASRTDYLIFCAAWTVFGLLLHWAMTFAIANAWAILTCILWFIAGCVASSANCTSFYWWWRVCFSSVPEWRAIEAFAWLSFIAFIALPFCLWSDVKRCDMDWMDGEWALRETVRLNQY